MENLCGSGWVSTCILVTHRSTGAAFCSRSYEILRGHVTDLTEDTVPGSRTEKMP